MSLEIEIRHARLAKALAEVGYAIAEVERRGADGTASSVRGLERLRADIVSALRLLEQSSSPGKDAGAAAGGHSHGVTPAGNRG